MNRKSIFYLGLVIVLCALPDAGGVSIAVGEEETIDVNFYLDFEYSYHGKMPMEMSATDEMGGMHGMPSHHGHHMSTITDGKIVSMDKTSTLHQHHANIVADYRHDLLRLHSRLGANHLFTWGDGGDEDAEILIDELYGEYTFRDSFKVRLGRYLAPFGIWNDIRGITPLLDTVVQPFIYEAPHNYSGSPLFPPYANVMVSGSIFGDITQFDYYVYAGTGKKMENHFDLSSEKSIGTKLHLTYAENLSVGLSAYTVEELDPGAGRESVYGLELEYTLLERLKVESEYVKSFFESQGDRQSYYVRLRYEMNKLTPYITYDYLEDEESLLYSKKGNRYGAGLSYRFNNNIFLKGEYHYHSFDDETGLPEDSKTTDMIKMAVVLAF